MPLKHGPHGTIQHQNPFLEYVLNILHISFQKCLPALDQTKIPSHMAQTFWDHKIRKLTPEKQSITTLL